MKPNRRLLLPPAGALLLAALAMLSGCHSAESRREEGIGEVHELIRTTHYQEALAESERLLEEEPADAELQALNRRALTAWMLDQGRRASFADQDVEALSIFERALEVSPDSVTVRAWIAKTRGKLADEWLEVALEQHAKDDLAEAIEAYQRALEYVPGHPSALRGLGETTILMNHRLGLGDDYYNEGLAALHEYWLRQALRNFSVTEKYVPENERATTRRVESAELIADNRVLAATEIEAQGLFAAALYEYRLALAYDPENEAAAAGAARVEPERNAAQLLRDADMLILRERYDEALEKLDEAAPLTLRQKEAITVARQKVFDDRLETLYQRALNLERDQQYPEAIVAYEKLFEHAEYYKDARTRQDTLNDYVKLAAEYYERAAKAESPSERLDLLRAIQGFWIEYEDVAEQIEALEPLVEPEGEPDAEPDEAIDPSE